MKTIDKIEEVLNIGVKNLVLTGAPGTGKTYSVKEYIAKQLGRDSWSEIPRDSDRVKLVQFHPSYEYTDFIEGYRPTEDGEFELTNGVFKDFCEIAQKACTITTGGTDNFDEVWENFLTQVDEGVDYEITLLKGNGSFPVSLNPKGTGLISQKTKTYYNSFNRKQCYNVYRGLPGVPSGGHDTYRRAIIKHLKENYGLQDFEKGKESVYTDTSSKYYFIIDEINRADLSKVFGETMMCLEDNYRGQSVTTQYGSEFSIPSNVIILATMNDIDRSVESFDFALRRRFRWIEIDADEFSFLKDNNIKHMQKAINEVIASEEGKKLGLDKHYKLGADYFKNAHSDNLDELWSSRIEPILEDYTRGRDNVAFLKKCKSVLNPPQYDTEPYQRIIS
jgi:MoxR-like ATPase